MTDERRIQVLQALIACNRPVDELEQDMMGMSWDSATDLVELKLSDLRSIVERILSGALSVTDARRWAELVEIREDIGCSVDDAEVIEEFVFDLANPDLVPETADALIHKWAHRLGIGNG